MGLEQIILAVLVSAAMVANSASPEEAETGDNQQFAKVVAEGSLANRQSFTFLDVEFKYAVGSAKNVEDAIAGKLMPGSMTAECIWIVDGDNIRFERSLDHAVLEAMYERALKTVVDRPEVSAALPIRTEKYLSAPGVPQLRYSPGMNVGIVQQPEIVGGGIELTPFDMGLMGRNEAASPGAMILEGFSEKNSTSCRFLGMREGPDGPLVAIECHGDDEWQYLYLFDPNRGYLPIDIEIRRPDGSLARRAVVTEAHECSGGKWFPMRAVVISGDGDTQGNVTVDEFVVTRLNVDQAPLKSQFVIDLPAMVLLNNGVDPESQIRIDQPSKVTFETLLELSEQLKNRALQAAPVQPVSSRPWGWAILFGICCIIVVAGIFTKLRNNST